MSTIQFSLNFLFEVRKKIVAVFEKNSLLRHISIILRFEKLKARREQTVVYGKRGGGNIPFFSPHSVFLENICWNAALLFGNLDPSKTEP